MSSSTPFLELKSISKAFPGVRALHEVSMAIQAGQVHALVGENGAGKSTLLRILCGVYQPDSGSIFINGTPISFNGPKSAVRAGIAMIHQELQLIPELNATQNIFLGQPLSVGGVFKRENAMRQQARDILATLNVTLDMDSPVKRLSVAHRQLIEIARALLGQARIIAMDEPTSSLTPREFEVLLRVIGDLRAKGVGIIYVSHRLNEVFQVADVATVLRDGEKVADVALTDVSERDIVALMVGRDLHQQQHKSHRSTDCLLRVENVSWGKRVHEVSFDLHRGEILGIAGLVGSGRTELMHLIAGLRRPTSGQILLGGQITQFSSPRQAIRQGIGMLPEDRKGQGIVPMCSVATNVTLPTIGRYAPLGLVRSGQRRQAVHKVAQEVNLRPLNVDREIRNFSGGNQQKAILARWLNAESAILIFDEPTRGIDVGAKQEIYALMEALAERGKAILMVSSELPEILRLSDRVLVMRAGRAVALLERHELNEATIMQHAIMATV
ncbi:MAG: sugar ABC transporter ATP-binding protein [Anaerolineae bacterium]|nr:sugar ABC transporter ATP-binding protein [Anaerolineae bacterium]MDW8172091.1 sugar ABC transporter ATP-binding protein [Anaerolineae bacterium]